MRKTLAVAVTLLLLISLVACIIPEKFIAKINLDKTGEFSFSYDGTLIFAPFKMGNPTQNDIAKIREELLRDPGFKKVKYVGNARYEVEYQKKGRLDQPFYFFNKDMAVIKMAPDQAGSDRVAIISGLQLSDKEIRDLQQLNVTIDGTLEVKTSGKILMHNATETPKFWGLFGAYKWKIKSPSDPEPSMLVKLE